jgi:hypothetical protein
MPRHGSPVSDQVLSSEGEPNDIVQLPPGVNIFQYASSAIRQVAQMGLVGNRKINDQIRETVRDDGPLLKMLRENFAQVASESQKRIADAARRRDFAAIRAEQKGLRDAGRRMGEISREIASDNSDQIVDLSILRRRGTGSIMGQWKTDGNIHRIGRDASGVINSIAGVITQHGRTLGSFILMRTN